jgi:NAD-dependent DNA ligase
MSPTQNKTKKKRKLILRGPPTDVQSQTMRRNEIYIDVLERLSKLLAKKGDPIRSRAYSKAQETIMSILDDIATPDQLKGKPNIGPTILEKLKEYDETGTLRLFEREKENPENIFNEIYGVGPKKAKELVGKGVKTLAQLRDRQVELLNETQRAGLKYYEDILERIPRSEIDEYNTLFEREFRQVTKKPEDQYEIVGSYRRGASSSGDIDVIITSSRPETFAEFIEQLKKTGILVEILSCGKTKCLVIAKLSAEKKARRVDFMYTSPEEFPFAILYFTGSKAFNTVMRGHALKQGMSLNEHGLYKKQQGKEKEDKVAQTFSTEQDVFRYLKLQYKEPADRTDGRAVIPISSPMSVPSDSGNALHEISKEQLIKEEAKQKTRRHREPFTEPKKPIKRRTLKIRDTSLMVVNTTEPIVVNTIEPTQSIPIVPVIQQTYSDIPSNLPMPTVHKKRRLTLKNTTAKTNINTTAEDMQRMDKGTGTKRSETKAKTKGTGVNQHIENFKKSGITVLENLSEKEIADMITTANDAYYNTQTALMSDNEFDIVKEYMEKKYPKNTVLEDIGAPVDKNKVTLPYEMASMDKIKPDTNALTTWTDKYKGGYVLSCKLDGVSGMYSCESASEIEAKPKLYTRGNGKVGQDVTHLLRVMNLPESKGYVVRGEFIIPKAVFDAKYKDRFANPRNLVSGIVNSKTIDEKTKDLHFVAYEVIQPTMKPSEQMAKLAELGFEVVQNKNADRLTNEMLSETLIDWRTNYAYEIDGVIVADDHVYSRKTGNPDHAFAFKMVISDQIAEAKVVDVLWTPSKSGYLKPRVRIEPIRLTGVTIEYATGFNASFIETHKIGIGATIQIIRSGDVIPHIKSVTVPAAAPKMPDVPYHWTDTHVDVVLDAASEDVTVREKNITEFFKGIEVDGLSSGNVKRMMNAGFDTIPKILHMEKSDYEGVEGFKAKLTDKIYEGIRDKVAKATLLDIMAASNQFGRGIGERKIKPMMEAYPKILTSSETTKQKITMLRGIKGIGPENAKSFAEHIPAFLTFLKECGLESKLREQSVQAQVQVQVSDNSDPLYGKHIVMTKVRDAHIIEELKKRGGVLDDSMSKQTFVLIVKSKDDVTNKTKYAVEHGIPILTPAEFTERYL